MVVTEVARTGHVLKDERGNEMLYKMVEKINDDIQGVLQYEKEALAQLFKICEESAVSPIKAVVKHTARITSYTNTAMFHARRTTC